MVGPIDLAKKTARVFWVFFNQVPKFVLQRRKKIFHADKDTLFDFNLLHILNDFHNKLPVNSLKVIGWVPRGVKQHNHIGSDKVKTKTTSPDRTKRRLSVESILQYTENELLMKKETEK